MRILILLIPFLLPPAVNAEVLRISTGHFPPYISLKEDEDLLLDLLDEVAEDMGVRFEYELNPWPRTEVNVRSHLSWGAVPYVKNEERLKIYSFSDPLYETDAVIIYFKGDAKMKALRYRVFSDLEGYYVSGIRGYYYQKALEKSGLRVSFLADELQNLRFLAAGRVDLIIMNSTVARYMIRAFFPDEQESFGFVPGKFIETGISLIMDRNYPGGEELMKRFNRSLNRVNERGTFERLLKEHDLAPPAP